MRCRKDFFVMAICLLALSSLYTSCTDKTSGIDDKAIADESRDSDWLAYGRTHNERRFSPLRSINKDNVGTLKVDWYLDLPKDNGLVSTPLVVNGIMYFVGSMNRVRAVDAASGKLLWEFDPEVAKHTAGRRITGWGHNRGITYYGDKIFTAVRDGRLIAIDSKTGKEVWTVQTFDPGESLYLTGSPKAFKGKVLIGNGGTENGPTRGYVTAYDAETGKQAWRFYIVPGDPAKGFEDSTMAMAAKTWTGEWWKHGGGGNAWHAITYDAELDQLYIGTGNGSPWNRKIRSPQGGDDLFLSSIVALNPDNGKYIWHYQTSPGETWDYNSNMDIVLADIQVKGQPVKAILHAPKNGFFYVIDRRTGKLVSADPFTEVTWASRVDSVTGRPVENPDMRYMNGPSRVAPSPYGGHSWHAMSFNPSTGLAYIPVMHVGVVFSDSGIDISRWHSQKFIGGMGVNMVGSFLTNNYPSSLVAWDPVKRKAVWEVPQATLWNAGTLTTAGDLVFQGRADGMLLAYDAATGKQLWSFNAGLGISAPPITFSRNGKQYISILVGFGGAYAGMDASAASLGWAYGLQTRRLITFSLDGKAVLPPQPPPHPAEPIRTSSFVSVDTLAGRGAALFGLCGYCHGGGAVSGGMAPDLRASAIPLDQGAFTKVVRGGERTMNGMPAFPDFTDEQLLQLRHFIRQQAEAAVPKVQMQGH